MKKIIIALLFAAIASTQAQAQSTMTDKQVLDFALKEQKAGTSRQQIVTKLMQRGVDISQIRRVALQYSEKSQDQIMGQAEKETTNDGNLRKPNTKKDTDNDALYLDNWNAKTDETVNHPQFRQFEDELSTILPTDTAELVEQLLKEREQKRNKVFGRDIFNNKSLTFEPAMNIATPRNYILGPGDAVVIEIYGASQRSINTTVTPDGYIAIEGYGPIQVSGLTVQQANSRIRNSLGSRYSSSRMQISLGQTRTITVNVMGEVKLPGTYTLSAFASVFHALYMAGGTNDLGTLRNIKVFRNNKLVSTVDIYDYILNGKQTGNIKLTDGDVITVGPYDCLVTIAGKVKRPMIYEMKKNESVSTLLRYAGGYTGDAYTKSVRLIRKTGKEYSVYNIEEFDMGEFRLSDEDSLTVDSILPRYSNMVEIKGAVFRPGKYQVGEQINSVRKLLEYAEGVTEEAFTQHAVMHRMKEDRTLKVVPLDIQGIMNGTQPDVALQPNDVIYIPTKQTMMQQQTITIHGEVFYPGIYKYAENETIEDFILQAGGLKETASTIKVDVARRVSDPAATTTSNTIAHTYTFALKDGFVIDGQPGFTLMPFDEVYVRRSPGFSNQKNVEITGNVMFAGVYTLSDKNERLSDLVKKCGGVTEYAFSEGARLERRMTDDEKLRMQSVLRLMQKQSTGQDSLALAKLDLGETYYVGIELNEAIKNPHSDKDIILREGDRIIVPEYNSTVKISGDVMYPNTVTYEKGKRPSYYIDQAGGFGNRAKKSHTFIIYMNGKVAKVGHNAKVRPGCEIVVPSKSKSATSLAEWLSISSTTASIATMIATIANIIF